MLRSLRFIESERMIEPTAKTVFCILYSDS